MDIGEYKEKSPYYGIWPVCLFLVVVPVGVYFLIRYALMTYQTNFSDQLNLASAQTVGCGVGVLFHLSALLCGVFKKPFKAVCARVADFFVNLTISFKLAWGGYVDDLRSGGVVFWIYFSIVLVNLGFFIDGLKKVLDIVIK